MNVLSTIVLMSILTIGGMGLTSQAFADHHQQFEDNDILYVLTDSDTYDHDSKIRVTGNVGNLRDGAQLTIVVTGPNGNLVTVDQFAPNSNGDYSMMIDTSSGLMKYDGTYKIKVQYDDRDIIVRTTVELVGGLEFGSLSSHGEHEHGGIEMFDVTSELSFNASSGEVHAIMANPFDSTLIITMHDVEDDGELSITLSNDVIEPFGDGGFFVLVNGEENHDYEQNGNFVIIPYEAGTSTIEIIGVSVVPEFGAIAGLVLAVAIISIIVLSAKTRLNVIPKF